ncbi:hypothetical protein [Ekhidna sp.]|uniref:hypothetical protein n=1 Tax=Ekhidna sp. TaxID=2608089 RepID=UPI003CCC0B74
MDDSQKASNELGDGKIVGITIAKIQNNTGVKNKAISKATGIDRNRLGRLINDSSKMYAFEVVRISNFLKVPIGELFDESIRLSPITMKVVELFESKTFQERERLFKALSLLNTEFEAIELNVKEEMHSYLAQET